MNLNSWSSCLAAASCTSFEGCLINLIPSSAFVFAFVFASCLVDSDTFPEPAFLAC